jgi:hypothetical protein
MKEREEKIKTIETKREKCRPEQEKTISKMISGVLHVI